MIQAAVEGRSVEIYRFRTHWEGWGKTSAKLAAQACQLVFPIDEIVDRFGGYWGEFIAREVEGDGVDTPEGIWTELLQAGYPQLAAMLAHHGELFGRLVIHSLQTEFVGYLLRSTDAGVPLGTTYFMAYLDYVDVQLDSVTLKGRCYELRSALLG